MMEKKELRRADFVTSILLILFSLIILIKSFQMPMKDTYGGVRNVWYVSPALLPLFIGFMLLLLGGILLRNSIRKGGAQFFFETIRKKTGDANREKVLRFTAIIVALGSFVYLFIPRIDFFLSILTFLFFFIVLFYFDDNDFQKKILIRYSIGCAVFLVLFIFNVHSIVNDMLFFAMDIPLLLFFIYLLLYTRSYVKNDPEMRKKYRIAWIISVIVPLIICPVFRYLLLVPLPHEGGIVNLMNLLYYAVK